MSGTIIATAVDLLLAKPLAKALGLYPNSLITSKTLSRVAGLTFSGLFKVLETVASETPALIATLYIVALLIFIKLLLN
jgi:hypothetical protein